MNILQVNKYYDPDIGGVETVCKQYSEQLSEHHNVVVICVNKKFSLFTSKEVHNNVKVYRCSSFGTFFSMPISISFFFYYICLLLKNELVISHLPFPLFDVANIITRLFMIKRPIYLVWHSDIVKQIKLRHLLSPLINYTLRVSRKVIVTSPSMVEYSYVLNKYQDKCHVIPLGINHSMFESFAESSPKSDGFIYDGIFFGRLTYYKGASFLIDSLVEAKAQGVEFNVLIAGEGEDEGYIESMISLHELDNVTFLNRFLSEREKFQFLSSSRCFLFPSTTNSEAFGITQLEAMLCGTPVINTNLKSGVPWVSRHNETGITIEPLDKQGFIDALLVMRNNNELRQALSSRCRDSILERFDARVIKNELLRFIKG
ncbi:glycosyltransferase [Aeromonas veronii]|uniref:glycosyltransferase n=1 Tax=Aeromonas veronii TaxID=654 RepID=UPI003F7C91E4